VIHCLKDSETFGFFVLVFFRRHLGGLPINLDGTASVANKATSCGKVSSMSVQKPLRKMVGENGRFCVYTEKMTLIKELVIVRSVH